MTNREKIQKAVSNTGAAIEAGVALAREPQILEIQGVPHLVMPEGLTASDKSALLPAPRRLIQNVLLEAPVDFAEYVNLFGAKDQTMLFAQSDGNSVTAFLDYHKGPSEASWKGHRATLTLKRTDPYEAWKANDGEAMGQAEFGRFIEEQMLTIAAPNGAVLLEMAENFEAKKDVTVQSGKRNHDGSTSFIYKEDVRETGVKVPSTFTLLVMPFRGTSQVQIEAKLRYRIEGGGKLVIWYDLVDIDEIERQAFQAAVKVIAGLTKDHVRALVFGQPLQTDR